MKTRGKQKSTRQIFQAGIKSERLRKCIEDLTSEQYLNFAIKVEQLKENK